MGRIFAKELRIWEERYVTDGIFEKLARIVWDHALLHLYLPSLRTIQVIAKPRDLATSIHSAFRQKKFGSADNIHQMDDTPPADDGGAGGNGRHAIARRTLDNHLLVDSPYGGEINGRNFSRKVFKLLSFFSS